MRFLKKSCDEPSEIDMRKAVALVNKKLKLYVLLAVLYGLVFINYIDLASSGPGYHAWLIMMYFFPFFSLSAMTFRKNFRLTLALGLIVSLMNDAFYFPMGYLFGKPFDLVHYYTLWLIPSNTVLFSLQLGAFTITVLSWMMALSIYARVALVGILLRAWKIRAEARCVNGKEEMKKTRLKFWDKIIEKL